MGDLTTNAIPFTQGLSGVCQAPSPHSLVAVHDGVQPVSDGDGGAVGELLLDGRLDEVIGL